MARNGSGLLLTESEDGHLSRQAGQLFLLDAEKLLASESAAAALRFTHQGGGGRRLVVLLSHLLNGRETPDCQAPRRQLHRAQRGLFAQDFLLRLLLTLFFRGLGLLWRRVTANGAEAGESPDLLFRLLQFVVICARVVSGLLG